MMRWSRSMLLVVVLAALFHGGTLSAAQKSYSQASEAARKLIEIKVTGSKRFSADAIAVTTGLPLGMIATEEDFKKGARRLGDLGVFTDIAYSFSFSPAGTRLEYHVTDAEKFVPARFEDFVWFTDAELRQRIQQNAPLFDGSLPINGGLIDQVSDVLQAMLVENHIPGHVEFHRERQGEDGPVEDILFQAADVEIHVRNFEFPGAAESELAALQSAARNFAPRQYSRAKLDAFVQRQLLPVYRQRGYLKAAFSEPQPKVVPNAGKDASDSSDETSRNQQVVDVAFTVTPGQQFKVKSISWTGNKEFPTDQLAKMVRLQPGEVANTVRLSDNLQDVQKLYGSRGYVTATIRVAADYDYAASTVNLRLEVSEGPVYHMGELEFRGLDNSLTAKLRSVWKIRQGDVYDSSYLSDYLPKAQKLLPNNFDWDVSSHVTANVRDRSVDVDLIYTVKAPK